jgi:hypothetical protein
LLPKLIATKCFRRLEREGEKIWKRKGKLERYVEDVIHGTSLRKLIVISAIVNAFQTIWKYIKLTTQFNSIHGL